MKQAVHSRQTAGAAGLRRIERDLVRSDPRLNALFIELTGAGPRQGDARHGADPDRATLAARTTGTAGAVTGPVRTGEPGGRFVNRAAVDQASSRLRLTMAVSISGVRSTPTARFGVLGTVEVPAAVAASREG